MQRKYFGIAIAATYLVALEEPARMTLTTSELLGVTYVFGSAAAWAASSGCES